MSKKQADEHLQEIRSKNHENKIRYLRRMQEQEELERYLKEELERLQDDEDG